MIPLYFKLQIMLMLAMRPNLLFDKISRLDWYGGMLRTWIDGQLGRERLRLLDVGCATGYLGAYVQSQGNRVMGIDRSVRMIGAASRLHPQLDLMVADACRLPFRDHGFDVVASASLVNIVPEPGRLLSQMFRVCRPGGRVTLLFPVKGFGKGDLQQLIAKLGLHGFSAVAMQQWHALAPAMLVQDVVDLVRTADCSEIEVTYYLGGMVAAVSAGKA